MIRRLCPSLRLPQHSLLSTSLPNSSCSHHHHHHLLHFARSETTFRHCSTTQDAPGDAPEMKSEYRPRFRPRRIILPIDPSDINSRERELGKDGAYLAEFASLRRHASKAGSVKLGVLPEEHTFAELFSAVLENVNNNIKRQKRMKEESNVQKTSPLISEEANSAFLDLSKEEDQKILNEITTTATTNQEKISDAINHNTNVEADNSNLVAYQLWDALEQVQISSPHGGGLGVLASQGFGLIQLEVTSYCFHKFPRLRSRHVESLLHSVIGLQPMLRLSTEIGLVSLARLDTDTELWKELCNMHQRSQAMTKLYYDHKSRLKHGQSSEEMWFYLKQMRYLKKAAKLFPTDASTLLPRVEWIRNSAFAFVGWLEISEGEEAARKFIRDNICTHFDLDGEFDGEGFFGGDDAESSNNNNNHNDVDPSTARQLRRRNRMNTTSNLVGAEPFDDPMKKYNAKMLAHLANARMISSVSPDNALKESQFILNYSPYFISLKNQGKLVLVSAIENTGMVQMDQEIEERKKVVKFDIRVKMISSAILESETMSDDFTDPERQSFYTPKIMEAELICFSKKPKKVGRKYQKGEQKEEVEEEEVVLGSGIGLTEQESMQACCLDFVRRYYFTKEGEAKEL